MLGARHEWLNDAAQRKVEGEPIDLQVLQLTEQKRHAGKNLQYHLQTCLNIIYICIHVYMCP